MLSLVYTIRIKLIRNTFACSFADKNPVVLNVGKALVQAWGNSEYLFIL